MLYRQILADGQKIPLFNKTSCTLCILSETHCRDDCEGGDKFDNKLLPVNNVHHDDASGNSIVTIMINNSIGKMRVKKPTSVKSGSFKTFKRRSSKCQGKVTNYNDQFSYIRVTTTARPCIIFAVIIKKTLIKKFQLLRKFCSPLLSFNGVFSIYKIKLTRFS